MKIGRATQHDIEAACSLIQHLSTLDDGHRPCAPEDQGEEWERFDWDDEDHLQEALKLLLSKYRSPPSGLERIVWGFGAMVDANLFDESVSHLALHPDLATRLAAEKSGEQPPSAEQVALQALQAGIHDWLEVRMAGYTDAQYGKGQLRQLLNASRPAPAEAPTSAPQAASGATPPADPVPDASNPSNTPAVTCWKCGGPSIMVPGGENCPGERGEDPWCPVCEVRFPEDESSHKTTET